MKLRQIILETILPLLLISAIVYLPIILNPQTILGRDNDLTEFFWPIIYYTKQSIITDHQVPLWSNLFFQGFPLVADPQNPLWYMPNIIFLMLDVDTGILVSLSLHFFFGLLGMMLLSRSVFRFSRFTSYTVAFLYAISPVYFSFLEAGHWGLIISWAWLPYFIISTHKLAEMPNLKYVALFVAAASSLYFAHILTAAIALFISIGYWFIKKSFKWAFISGVILGLVILPVFLIQFSWQKESTRNLLLMFPEVFPIWRGKMEFVKNIFLFNPETEKAITFGIIPSIAALIGFSSLRSFRKICVVLILIALSLIVLNNASPIHSLLLKIDTYILMRVSIRVWFIAYFLLFYLFGLGLEKLRGKILLIFLICGSIEFLMIGMLFLSKPINQRSPVPVEVYELLAKDKDIFRVFCTTRCISQKSAAIYNIHLADGYGTLQQQNYFEASMQIGQYYWDRYSLEIPPSSIYVYNKLQPHAPTLANYQIKYVISPHQLKDKELQLILNSQKFLVYENKLFTPLEYVIYSPNNIRIKVDKFEGSINVPEIYNKWWNAYDDTGNMLEVSENEYHTIRVNIPNKTQTINLYFRPTYN